MIKKTRNIVLTIIATTFLVALIINIPFSYEFESIESENVNLVGYEDANVMIYDSLYRRSDRRVEYIAVDVILPLPVDFLPNYAKFESIYYYPQGEPRSENLTSKLSYEISTNWNTARLQEALKSGEGQRLYSVGAIFPIGKFKEGVYQIEMEARICQASRCETLSGQADLHQIVDVVKGTPWQKFVWTGSFF